jgi:type IV pilus assembly protein PilY1
LDTDPLTESQLYDATDNALELGDEVSVSQAKEALAGKKGWMIKLSDSGEKVMASSYTFHGAVYFTSFTPSPTRENCQVSQGVSRLYAVSVLDGTSTGWLDDDDNTGIRFTELLTAGIPTDPTRLRTQSSSGLKDLLCVGTECKQLPAISPFNPTFWYVE